MRKEPARTVPGWRARGAVWFALDKLFDVAHVFIAMCLSELLIKNAAMGGALYLAGQVWVLYVRLFRKRGRRLLPSVAKASGLVIFVAAALLCVVLLLVYPTLARAANMRPLLWCIALLLLRQAGGGAIAWLLRRRGRAALRVLLLLAWHAALSALILRPLHGLLAPEAFWVQLALVSATGLMVFFSQCFDHRAHCPADAQADPDSLQNVSAYRVYNRMVSSVLVALNISIFTYICYIRFQPAQDMIAGFCNLLLWLLFVAALTLLLMLFFRRRRLVSRYDKPSVFVVGALLFSAACIGTYHGWFAGLSALICDGLWIAGLACMLAVMIAQGDEMREVLELSLGPVAHLDYSRNTMAVAEWSVTLSTLLLVALLTLISFFMEGRMAEVEAMLGVQSVMRVLMLLLPPLFLLAALVFALMQPLNKDYERKLAHFRAQQRLGKVNAALETRLQMQLAKRTRHIVPGLLRTLVRPFMPCRVIGRERVDVENGPVVFVCNHLEIYGPLITNLHLPFYFRSWIISSMLDQDVIVEQLSKGGVDTVFHFLPAGLRRRIPRWIAPIMVYTLRALDPIPVYRGTVRESVKTLKLTVEAMEYEDNILIFPENSEAEGETGKYKEEGVSQFFSGFSSIGSEYYKRTGGRTVFYPMYANKKKRTLTIGEGIRFDPENPRAVEKERIVRYLHDWMQAEAAK